MPRFGLATTVLLSVVLGVGLIQTNGIFDRMWKHWVLGQRDTPPSPRWSVLRNVLGWVE